MKMNLPNKLTILRIVMVPFFVFFLLADFVPHRYLFALILFCAASYTDHLAGKIARRDNLITNFGKLMDPLADKILVMSALICLAGENVNILIVLLKILLFFVFVAVVAFVGIKGFTWYENRYKKNLHRFPLLAFVLCLGMAYIAERVFGVADIIGAFAAGVIIANTPRGAYIDSKFQPLSYLLLTPVFFASIGLKVSLPSMTWQIGVFALLLVLTAILSKLVGCGLGAKVCGFDWRESLQVGLGMACRGEVALIVANKGAAIGLMPEEYFGPVIITVVVCSMFTPIALKLAFRKDGGKEEAESSLVNRYELASGYANLTDEEARKRVAEKAAEDAKTQQTAGPKEK